MTKTTTVVLLGGLGNQMFQFAAGLAVATESHTRLVLDESLLRQRIDGVVSRSVEIDAFRIGSAQASVEQRIGPVTRRLLQSERAIARAVLWRMGWLSEAPASEGYEALRVAKLRDVTLRGYFQSWRYFNTFADELLQRFVLREPSSWAIDFSEYVAREPNSVALHVRRGDYMSRRIAQRHGVLPLSYYESALAQLKLTDRVGKVFIFCDEPDRLTREERSLADGAVVVREPEGTRPAETMTAMASASAVVAANSSFSWWAAWLAWMRTGAHVVVPKPWTRDPALTNPDMSPPEWDAVPHGWSRAVRPGAAP